MKWRIYKLLVRLRNTTALDSRALSLFRIGIGLLLIADLLIRFSDLEAFYTDNGLVPRSLVWNTFWNTGYIPIHTLSGEKGYMLFLFIFSILSAVLFTLGWKTRLFTFLSWLLLISLHNRNPYILQGGDELLRLSLFWGMFLPLGRHYSLDVYKKGLAAPKRIKGLACTGYVLLIFSVYFFSALQKNSAEWQTDGTAVYYALSLDQMVLPAGEMIYPYPTLLKILTHAIFGIELLGGFLLFFPNSKPGLRTVGLILLALLHIGIGFTLYVGLFYIIGLITLIPLLPSRFMHRVERWIFYLGKKFKKPSAKKHVPRINSTLHAVQSFFLGAVILFCLVWNISNVPFVNVGITEGAKYPAAVLRIDQNWGMFAPTVFKDDGWFIYEGITKDGKHIDISHHGKKISLKKPYRVVSMFKNDRWRKYSENVLFTHQQFLRPLLCTYMISKWNKENPHRQIDNLKIIYMKEVSLPNYKISKPVREILVQYK